MLPKASSLAEGQSDSFSQFNLRLSNCRATYEQKRVATNLYSPQGLQTHDLNVETVKRYSFWFEEGPSIRCVRVYDVPDTLSGDILRLKAQLPPFDGDCEIDGNVVRPLLSAPSPPEPHDDDTEDVSALVGSLPIVEDSSDKKLFFKKPKYASEIMNLLRCQGGQCHIAFVKAGRVQRHRSAYTGMV